MNESPSSEHASFEHHQNALPEMDGMEEARGVSKVRRYGLIAGIVLAAAILAAIVGIWVLPGDEGAVDVASIHGDDRSLDQVTDLVYPAKLLWENSLDSAAMPADLALVDDRIFLLDTNNNRMLEIDAGGDILQELDVHGDSGPALQNPMAMTAHGGKLYVSNSGAGNVIVLTTEGVVERVITLKIAPSEHPLRPLGIVVDRNGDIFLSDPDNHRVLHLDKDGNLVSTLGSGVRDSGEYGFNTPAGLFLDDQGNLYVVDILNYSVKKYSPSGEFLLSIGDAGDTEGAFSRPKTVAVDGEGRVFVSDTLLVAIEVFEPDGVYLGFIGRRNPEDKRSESMFQAPHGLKIDGDTLYVVDRFAGLFALQLHD
jgi:DNA-binding beta-propeller fold protein YncE